MNLYPLYLPLEARRLFQTESLLRRFAQAGHFGPTTRLLEFHGSLGGLALARALNCTLTIAEPDPQMLDALKDRASAANLSDRVTFVNGTVDQLEFPAKSFDGAFALGRIVGPLEATAERVRPWLDERGRMALTSIVKVGHSPAEPSLAYWKKRLGQELLLPRDALMSVEKLGFEPELIEALSEEELGEYYKELDGIAAQQTPSNGAAKDLREEAAVHRAQAGRSGVTWAVAVFRRKEPGEKPPASRDSG